MTTDAKIILDSISPEGVRLTTMVLTYARFVHAEFMTHRVFSRNASSSRAIPIETMIQQVIDDPAMPSRWGVGGRGMQDHGTLSPFFEARTKKLWLEARDTAVGIARDMISGAEKPAKQIVNRILEPFAHITVIVSATEWENFWHLRCHEDADPTIRELADKAHAEYTSSKPSLREPGEWHLPYVDNKDIDDAIEHTVRKQADGQPLILGTVEREVTNLCCLISVARCARVSYLTHDKRRPSITEDLELAERLINAGVMHASPFEHQATPDDVARISDWSFYKCPGMHGNFRGWKQHRKMFVGEAKWSHSGFPKQDRVSSEKKTDDVVNPVDVAGHVN